MVNRVEESTATTDQHTEAYHNLADHPTQEIIEDARPVVRPMFSHLTEQPNHPVTVRELSFGALMFILWTAFFSAGAFVSTKDARQAMIGSAPTLGSWMEYGVIVICCYTLTNVLFLSCFASMLGCMMCRWRVRHDESPALARTLPGCATIYSPERLYLSAFLRGFFFYLIMISGLLVISNEVAIVDTTFVQYIRMAGFISMLSFAAGYDPNVIYHLIGRISDVANTPLASKARRVDSSTNPK